MKQLTILFLVKPKYVLLAMKKRGFGQGRYNGVGGKVEPGETVEQAMIRECQEEICVTPIIFHKAAEITFDELLNGWRKTLDVHAFICTQWQGEPAETEEMAPQWFKTKEIPYSQMWPDDPHWLPQILDGKHLKCHFTLDDNDKVIKKSIKEIESFSH